MPPVLATAAPLAALYLRHARRYLASAQELRRLQSVSRAPLLAALTLAMAASGTEVWAATTAVAVAGVVAVAGAVAGTEAGAVAVAVGAITDASVVTGGTQRQMCIDSHCSVGRGQGWVAG